MQHRSAGEYEFSHRSMQAFFLAWHVTRALDDSAATSKQLGDRLNGPRLSSETVQSLLLMLPQTKPQLGVLKAALLRVLSVADGIAHAPSAARVNALVLGHAFAVRDAGPKRNHAAIRRNCQLYIPDEAQLENAVLKGLALDGIRLRKAMLSGADLSETDLTGADLRDAVMERVSLRNARLVDTVLASACLNQADASNATVQGVTFDGANAAESIWAGAVLARLRMSDANFRGADFSDALFDDEATRLEVEYSVGA
jgi:hypothetical protein